MATFLLEIDVPNLFKQLLRYTYLITEGYKDKNPDIFKQLHKQYEELRNDEVSQRNYYKHFWRKWHKNYASFKPTYPS